VVAGPRVHSAHFAQTVVEPSAWPVDVEQPRTLRPGVRESVHDTERRRDEATGPEAERLVFDLELGLAGEDVEGIDLVVVGVPRWAFEARLELELDQRDLLTPDLDRRDTCLRLEPFALTGREEDRVVRGRPTAGGNVDAVETARFAAVARPQMVGKAAVRSMEVK